MAGRVRSVNVSSGRKIEFNGAIVGTGIFKEPVCGRVMARRLNIDGDRQVDLRYHGGEHKAVYAYPYEHYARWAEELNRADLVLGQFGENLTIEGWTEEAVHIGDRFQIGGALLEVTQPRVPCFKLGIKMGDSTFPKRFIQSMRPGFYLRVLEEGELGEGDAMERVETGAEAISVRALYYLRFRDPDNRSEIQRALSIPALSKEWRKELTGL